MKKKYFITYHEGKTMSGLIIVGEWFVKGVERFGKIGHLTITDKQKLKKFCDIKQGPFMHTKRTIKKEFLNMIECINTETRGEIINKKGFIVLQ